MPDTCPSARTLLRPGPGSQDSTDTEFVMDTEHDSRQLVSALQRLAAKRAGAIVGWDGTTITLAACR